MCLVWHRNRINLMDKQQHLHIWPSWHRADRCGRRGRLTRSPPHALPERKLLVCSRLWPSLSSAEYCMWTGSYTRWQRNDWREDITIQSNVDDLFFFALMNGIIIAHKLWIYTNVSAKHLTSIYNNQPGILSLFNFSLTLLLLFIDRFKHQYLLHFDR